MMQTSVPLSALCGEGSWQIREGGNSAKGGCLAECLDAAFYPRCIARFSVKRVCLPRSPA